MYYINEWDKEHEQYMTVDWTKKKQLQYKFPDSV